MRSIALDVHRDFCEVAIVEDGEVRSAGRIATSPESIALFAGSLCPTDQVVLETTSGAIEIARLLGPHVARVVLANAADVRAIAHARVKSDRFDAATLARLLAAGMLDGVWVPDERIGAARRAGSPAHACQERDPRGDHALPARTPAGLGPVRQEGPRLAHDAAAAAGRGRRGLPAPGRLPRHGDRRNRRQARRVRADLAAGQASDDDPRC